MIIKQKIIAHLNVDVFMYLVCARICSFTWTRFHFLQYSNLSWEQKPQVHKASSTLAYFSYGYFRFFFFAVVLTACSKTKGSMNEFHRKLAEQSLKCGIHIAQYSATVGPSSSSSIQYLHEMFYAESVYIKHSECLYIMFHLSVYFSSIFLSSLKVRFIDSP